MGSRALVLLRTTTPLSSSLKLLNKKSDLLLFRKNLSANATTTNGSSSSSLQPPDLPRLAQTARISLTPQEVEEFAPKINQVIDWFGQLQAVDLTGVQPSIRADTEGENLREDIPVIFDDREAILSAVPTYEEPYIKVPKVLNKE